MSDWFRAPHTLVWQGHTSLMITDALRERRTAIIAAIARATWNARRPHQRWIAGRGLAPKSVSRIDRAEVTPARGAVNGPAEVAALSREGDILPRVPFRRVRVSDLALAGGIVWSADRHPCPEDEARGSRQETTESRVIQSGVRGRSNMYSRPPARRSVYRFLPAKGPLFSMPLEKQWQCTRNAKPGRIVA
jgi:hypothetical protein